MRGIVGNKLLIHCSLVCIFIFCSACGPDTSSEEWKEPVHFSLVINEAGWCQMSISSYVLKKRDVIIEYFESSELVSEIICPNVNSWYPGSPLNANISISGGRKGLPDFGRYVPKGDRKYQILEYPDDFYASIRLLGRGSMGSIACHVVLSLWPHQEIKLFINLGESQDTHVLVGVGNRVCTS